MLHVAPDLSGVIPLNAFEAQAASVRDLAAGVMDVFGVAAAALAIVVLLLILGSLFSWLRQDLAITFADLTDNITDAVIIGK